MSLTRTPMREAIQLFDSAAQADGRAKSTLDNMRSHAKKLERAIDDWQKAKNRWQPMNCDEADIQLFTFFLARCVGGAGNRTNMVAYFRNLLKFCERNHWLAAGSSANITYSGKKGTAYQRKRKTFIDSSDFPTLLECQTKHPADRATMALLLWTLSRKSELYALRWKHVDLMNRNLRVWRVKTQRWTDVGVCPELYRELLDYQEWYADEMDGDMNPEWHVLPELIPVRGKDEFGKYDGTCTSYKINPERHPHHMEKIVKHALDVIGVTDTEHGKTVNHLHEGAHTIRRSGARAMLKYLSSIQGYGDALVTVSVMLDHRDVKVTLAYIGMDKQKDQLNEWLKTNSPYGRGAAA